MANKVVVKYSGKNVSVFTLGRGDNMKLMPGVNVIDATTWARFTDAKTGSPGLRSQVGVGAIKAEREVFAEGPAGAGSDDENDSNAEALATLKTKDAVALVRDTFDVELLKKWAGATADRKVSAAIATQLDLILNAPDDKDTAGADA